MEGSPLLRRLAGWGLAGVSLVFGTMALGLGASHPVAPWLVSLLLVLAAARVARQPGAWLFWLPALLPVLNFSPWTGWWLLDESDLMVLAILAGGYARWAWELRRIPAPRAPHAPAAAGWPGWRGASGLGWLCLALVAWAGLGVCRGLADAGGLQIAALSDVFTGLYAGYDSAWNSLRVAKSLLWALLLLPLMRHRSWAPAGQGAQQLARGMVVGLALTCVVVLVERQLYAGVFDFSRSYRTSAWFWEMHVGGGAIDAYLALAAPFAFWAVWTAPRGWRWWAAQLLLWLTVYVVLTTYSRGIYLATLIALGWMAFAAWHWKIPAAAGAVSRGRALLAVAAVVLVESLVVLGGGAFMGERLAQANTDLVGRLTHWRSSLGLIQSPVDGLLGIGWGRLPARYSREVPGGEFPGQARWAVDTAGQAHAELSGPATRPELAARFALTQRVPLEAGGSYTARVKTGAGPSGRMMLTLCVRHLLYSDQCQGRLIGPEQPPADAQGWQQVELQGPDFEAAHEWGGSLRGVLSVTALEPGQTLRLYELGLTAPSGTQMLRNPGFAERFEHWLPGARAHFYPWHIDNLYVETLVERGVLGWLLLGTCFAFAGWGLRLGLRRGDLHSWVVSAALLSFLALGMVISVWEVPRVALLALIYLWQSYPKEVQTR